MIIRDFRKGDLEDVIECTIKSFADEFEIMGFDPDVWRKMVRRRFAITGRVLFGLFRLLDREPIKFFVADVDGRVVGTTMLNRRRNSCYISTVMVRPDFRRKGIAASLLKTAIDYAQKRELPKAILQVSSTNDAAKPLYRKLGFEKFEETLYFTADVDSLLGSERAEGVQVRDFEKPDEDAVYELIKRSRDQKSLEVYNFQKKDLRTSFWNRMARMASVKKIVAVKDEKIVGYASVSCTSKKEAGRVTSLDVSPEMTSKGIEEELLWAGASYAKSFGTKTVLVIVPLRNEELVERLEGLGLRKQIVMEGMLLQ